MGGIFGHRRLIYVIRLRSGEGTVRFYTDVLETVDNTSYCCAVASTVRPKRTAPPE